MLSLLIILFKKWQKICKYPVFSIQNILIPLSAGYTYLDIIARSGGGLNNLSTKVEEIYLETSALKEVSYYNFVFINYPV